MTQPIPAPAEGDALRRLIRQWRAAADWMMGSTSPDEWQRGGSGYLMQCANELELALRSASRTTTTPTPPLLPIRDAAEFALRAVADTLLTILVELPDRYGDKHTIDRRIAIAAAQKMKGDAIRAVDAAIVNHQSTTPPQPTLVQALTDYQLEARSGHYTSSRQQVMDLIQRTIEELQAQAGRVPNHGQRL